MENNKIYKVGYLKTAKRKYNTVIPCFLSKFEGEGEYSDYFDVYCHANDLFYYIQGSIGLSLDSTSLMYHLAHMKNWTLNNFLLAPQKVQILELEIIKFKRINWWEGEFSKFYSKITFEKNGKIKLI